MKLYRVLLSCLTILLLSTCSYSGTKQTVSLKQKIGQMLMIGFKGTAIKADDPIVQAIKKQQIGGVILFDYDFNTKTYDRNIKNPQQLKQLITDLQSYTRQAARMQNNALMPLLIGIDYEGGKVNRLKENYGFPKTLSAQVLGTLPITKVAHYAKTMADTMQQVGINFNFAPVVDVNINPNNPVIGKLERSFSADPNAVVTDAGIFAKTFTQGNIACAFKHFPGHGSSTGDTHAGFVDVTNTWQPEELIPYQQLLQQSNSCTAVMIAHVIHKGLDAQGLPASLSHAITTDLLRKKLKFDGVIVTDDLQMGAIKDNYGLTEAIRLAINAGADILVFGNQLVPVPQDPQALINIIYNDVQTGKIAVTRIEEAYQHIMILKQKLKN